MSLREPQSLLHNMSAPPRAQIGFRVVRPAGVPPVEGVAAACGLRWLARFDAAGLLAPPFEPGVSPDLAQERATELPSGLFFNHLSGLAIANIKNLFRLACRRGGAFNVEDYRIVGLDFSLSSA